MIALKESLLKRWKSPNEILQLDDLLLHLCLHICITQKHDSIRYKDSGSDNGIKMKNLAPYQLKQKNFFGRIQSFLPILKFHIQIKVLILKFLPRISQEINDQNNIHLKTCQIKYNLFPLPELSPLQLQYSENKQIQLSLMDSYKGSKQEHGDANTIKSFNRLFTRQISHNTVKNSQSDNRTVHCDLRQTKSQNLINSVNVQQSSFPNEISKIHSKVEISNKEDKKKRVFPTNHSKDSIKNCEKVAISTQKVLVGNKSKQAFKPPEWLKQKKKQKGTTIENNDSCIQRQHTKTHKVESTPYTASTNLEQLKNRADSINIKKAKEQTPVNYEKGVKSEIKAGQTDMPQNYKSKRSSEINTQKKLKLSSLEHYEIENIRLEEEIKNLKCRIQNLEEDKKILSGRIQTLQSEISFCNKKIYEFASREDFHRNMQSKLKQKIQDLQNKLTQAKDQIIHKSDSYESNFKEEMFYNERQIIQKKNEEISRLNEIINKTRSKVNQLSHELTQQKINNVKNMKSVQQKYGQMLDNQQKQIEDLKKYIQCYMKQKKVNTINVPYSHSRYVTEPHPENIKKVVSATHLTRGETNRLQ